MAPIAKTLAIAATAFAALGAAAPSHGHKHNHKREEVTVWSTTTTVVWKTVDVTTTIYPGQETPPSTYIEETVDQATAPAQPEPETTSTSTFTSTSTSTSAAEPTSTAEAEPSSVETQAPEPTNPIVSTPPKEPAPIVPTTTEAAPVETSTVEPQPAPTQSSGGSSSGGGGPCSASSPCTGQVTFYDTATTRSAPSSCGTTNDGGSENVIALPVGMMKDGDCGRTVTIKYGGKTSTGTVVDKCMGCDNTSIDLSRHFFSELASFAEGRLHGVEWWLD